MKHAESLMAIPRVPMPIVRLNMFCSTSFTEFSTATLKFSIYIININITL